MRNLSKKSLDSLSIELEEKLILLLYYAKANLYFCQNALKDIKDNEPKDAINKNKYINESEVLYKSYISIFHLHEVINILSTLFCPSENEVSFQTYYDKVPDFSKKLKREISKLADEFGKKKLKRYRNVVISHKDLESFGGDPYSFTISRTKPETLDYFSKTIETTITLCRQEFKHPMLANNYFLDNTKEGFEKVILRRQK